MAFAYMAWKPGVPATYHLAMGTDIIHQHPHVDFGAIGVATGRDFHTMANTVSQLDGGCYLNFGSRDLRAFGWTDLRP